MGSLYCHLWRNNNKEIFFPRTLTSLQEICSTNKSKSLSQQPPLLDETCSFKGEEFKADGELVTKDCKYRCKCNITDGVKAVSCSGLCQGSSITCGFGEEIAYEDKDVEGTECACQEPVCKKKPPKGIYLEKIMFLGTWNLKICHRYLIVVMQYIIVIKLLLWKNCFLNFIHTA